ncbi:hypothetical protein ABES02_28640 [Neobacillus pocheonensis]|uniref:hypothetical protein n=1 Tax=Neobacillus pocheonensis TaxID=363869 RepID=UPI003D2B4921
MAKSKSNPDLQVNEVKAYLQRFFDEKQLQNQEYSIELEGKIHTVDTAFMIDFISNRLDEPYQIDIQKVLIRLDACNTDVHHFLKYLAKGYVEETHKLNTRFCCRECGTVWDDELKEGREDFVQCDNADDCDNEEFITGGKEHEAKKFIVTPIIR